MPARDTAITINGVIKWGGIIVAVAGALISLVLYVSGMKSDLATAMHRIEQLEAQKGSETRVIVEQHGRQIDQIQDSLRRVDEKLTGIDKNLSVVAAWIEGQKEKPTK